MCRKRFKHLQCHTKKHFNMFMTQILYPLFQQSVDDDENSDDNKRTLKSHSSNYVVESVPPSVNEAIKLARRTVTFS